jgi:hypothetical protein
MSLLEIQSARTVIYEGHGAVSAAIDWVKKVKAGGVFH